MTTAVLKSFTSTAGQWDSWWPRRPLTWSRNGMRWITVRRFGADRVTAIRRLKALKAAGEQRDVDLAACELAAVWLELTGNPGAWTVTNVAGGHSAAAGAVSFGQALAEAAAERLNLGYLKVFADRPVAGVSHPKEFRKLEPLDVIARPIGPTLLVDDVSTSGWHIAEALAVLRQSGQPAAAIAWISAAEEAAPRGNWRIAA